MYRLKRKNLDRQKTIMKEFFAGGVSAASMLVSATSSDAILGGQQLAQAVDVSRTYALCYAVIQAKKPHLCQANLHLMLMQLLHFCIGCPHASLLCMRTCLQLLQPAMLDVTLDPILCVRALFALFALPYHATFRMPKLLSRHRSMTVRYIQSGLHGILPSELIVANFACIWTVHGVAMPYVIARHAGQTVFGMSAGRSHV